MSEVKDPAIKLFGRTISLTLILNDSPSAPPPPSSSPSREVTSSASLPETEESSKKELTSVQDNDRSHQTTEDLKSATTSSGMFENPKTPSAERENSLPKSSTNGEQSETTSEKTPKKPDKILPCPRCNSMDTKFCYYNNYNVNQPRHFCKNCQRYWTAGGTMRNVPVGAGRRKNKNSTASQYRQIMVPEAMQAAAAGLNDRNAVLSFGPDSPLCDSMSSVLSIADQKAPAEPSTYVSYVREDEGNDHSIGASATTCSHESMDRKRTEGFPPQLAYFQSSSPWPYPPWNSAVPPPAAAAAFVPPGYPVSFYTTPPPYWGCVGPSWNNVPCVSGPNSPLGKHSRDGNIITTQSNPQKENPNTETNNNSVLIPKTLRIDDPSEAAKSSIWSTLGIKNDKAGGGGLFKAFPSSKAHHAAEALPVLHANPAALSRSLTFHERT